jgi:hypothetical protein
MLLEKFLYSLNNYNIESSDQETKQHLISLPGLKFSVVQMIMFNFDLSKTFS